MKHRYKVIVLYFLLVSFLPSFSALDSITPNQTIHENDTLVSAGGTFEAGIFGFGDSQRYFGIWYRSISPRTVVWVANRDTPLESSSGVFKITEQGVLVITNGTNGTIWSSNTSRAAKKPVGQLLESGNLIVKDGDGDQTENFLWQSFDYPGDTLLPGMKIASNLVTGPYRYLTSWRNVDDPTPGNFSMQIDIRGYPQEVTTKGSSILYRAGSWNGYLFTGVPWQSLHQFFNYSFVLTENEVYFQYQLLNSSGIPRYMITSSGDVQRFTWSDQTQSWELFLAGPVDQCDNYALCGANSNCNVNNSPICECLEGFIQEKGTSLNRSNGCVRRTNLSCNNDDGFIKYAEMKLPDTSSSWFDKSISLGECKTLCLKNCSCIAYANLDVRDGGNGCLLWFDIIIDMRKQTSQGQDIYIKVAASELDLLGQKRHINKKLAVSLSVVTVFIVVILGYAIYVRRRKYEAPGEIEVINRKNHDGETEKKDIDLPTMNLSTIAIATNNFSFGNILGEGGYGPVYKGSLPNGQRIAVKRLSKNSGQGPEEFKNEVLLLAHLQHRNLVRIIGCCIQDDERILIYEFMPNRSLDYFIFGNIPDQTSNLMDWNRRFQIICGIARGLLYLHQDSRLRIIHRDLKPSNILLDECMNPKISDFGIARIFGGDQSEAKTKRVVGTYGYIPPEYALHGNFSVKSDVFSFGVIVLETISGRKNREFSDPHDHLNLLGHAWRLWSEDKPLEFLDESLGDSITLVEASRSIIIGLLCVQERPEDRPDMSSVVLMLNGEKGLPNPSQPGFFPHVGFSSSESRGYSTNEISMTLDAR